MDDVYLAVKTHGLPLAAALYLPGGSTQLAFYGVNMDVEDGMEVTPKGLLTFVQVALDEHSAPDLHDSEAVEVEDLHLDRLLYFGGSRTDRGELCAVIAGSYQTTESTGGYARLVTFGHTYASSCPDAPSSIRIALTVLPDGKAKRSICYSIDLPDDGFGYFTAGEEDPTASLPMRGPSSITTNGRLFACSIGPVLWNDRWQPSGIFVGNVPERSQLVCWGTAYEPHQVSICFVLPAFRLTISTIPDESAWGQVPSRQFQGSSTPSKKTRSPVDRIWSTPSSLSAGRLYARPPNSRNGACSGMADAAWR